VKACKTCVHAALNIINIKFCHGYILFLSRVGLPALINDLA
jgi:hypothetical protein